MDIGFDREHVLAARLDVRSLGFDDEHRQALYRRLIERLQRVPGVASVSLSMNGPLANSTRSSSFGVEGYTPARGEQMVTNEETVTEDYFGTVGLRLLRGRPFGPEDRAPGSRTTIINETMAKRFFSGRDPLGKRWTYGDRVGPDSFVIIGVVEDAKYVSLRRSSPTMAYHLAAAVPDEVLGDLEVRTSIAPSALTTALRQAVTESEPGLPMFDVVPLADRVARVTSSDALVATLTTVFGGVALLLGCLGLYGTMSYGISRRVPEIGLRMALGADRRLVLGMVLREALLIVLIGGAIGVPVTYAAARAVATLLYQVPPIDPTAYAAGGLLLVAVAAVAAYLPARRASRIDPMEALGRG
jgi:predicted permease